MGRVYWLIRVTGFALIGILALINPARSAGEQAVQIACFSAVALGLVAWGAVDVFPRYRSWGLPAALGVIAVAGGVAAVTTGNGQSLVVFALAAASWAGSDTDMPASIAVAAAGIVAIWVAGAITGASFGTLAGYPLAIVVCLMFGLNRRSYRVRAEQSAALLAQHKQLRAEQRRADVLDERARLAREIHDVLAHSLGALGIQIQAARSVLHKDPDRAGALLAAAQQMAAEGLTETRRAVHALRTDTLPLGEELARASDAYAQRYGVAVSFDTAGVPAALPPDATVALLRIAQEALVNAAKHAAGQGVTVRLDYGDSDVRLTVRNGLAQGAGTGDAADVSTVNGGYGLTGMRERLRLLNGTLEAGSRDGQWIVTAELPRPETMTQ